MAEKLKPVMLTHEFIPSVVALLEVIDAGEGVGERDISYRGVDANDDDDRRGLWTRDGDAVGERENAMVGAGEYALADGEDLCN